jgi:hypothetical protein
MAVNGSGLNPKISHPEVNVAQAVERRIRPLSLREAQRRSNPSSWIATLSFLGLAMTEESVSYAGPGDDGRVFAQP